MARSNYKPKGGHKFLKLKMVGTRLRGKKKRGKKEKIIGKFFYILQKTNEFEK